MESVFRSAGYVSYSDWLTGYLTGVTAFQKAKWTGLGGVLLHIKEAF